jgi:hypothetical protein
VSLVDSFLLEDQNSATLSSGEVTRLCTEGIFLGIGNAIEFILFA